MHEGALAPVRDLNRAGRDGRGGGNHSDYIADAYAGSELDQSRNLPVPGSNEHIAAAFCDVRDVLIAAKALPPFCAESHLWVIMAFNSASSSASNFVDNLYNDAMVQMHLWPPALLPTDSSAPLTPALGCRVLIHVDDDLC